MSLYMYVCTDIDIDIDIDIAACMASRPLPYTVCWVSPMAVATDSNESRAKAILLMLNLTRSPEPLNPKP